MEDFGKFSIVDLSVTIDEGFPLTWPGMPPVQKRTINWYEPIAGSHGQPLAPSMGAFYSQSLYLDEHTGTHVDFPSHNIPASSSGLANAGPAGDPRGDEYPLQNLCGPADVIDVKFLLDSSRPGTSAPITAELIEKWELANGKINPGDVALLNSGFCDKYFSKLPAGNRMFEPVTTGKVPGWPAPSPAAIELLYERGVRHIGVTAPTIGAVEDLGAAHIAGLSRGMSFTEMLVNLDELPPRGAWFFMLPLKIAAQSGGPGRAIAMVPRHSGK